MKRRRTLTTLLSLGCALVLVQSAVAEEFSPTARFTLSTRKVNANPSLTINVAQDQGEEELASVTLTIPKGFKLPLDAAIANGEQLGAGEIRIAAEPLCQNMDAPVPVRINERDRTDAERAQGVKAVWVVDLRPVTSIDLKIKGSSASGWTLTGPIPSNAATCPPFSFSATIFQRSSVSNTRIIVNPAAAGAYVFKATFTGVGGSVKTIKQTIQITN